MVLAVVARGQAHDGLGALRELALVPDQRNEILMSKAAGRSFGRARAGETMSRAHFRLPLPPRQRHWRLRSGEG